MRGWALILGAAAGLAAWPGAAQPPARTSIGFTAPAHRLWEASTPLPACMRPGARITPVAAQTPHPRLASRQRRGELVGEFLPGAPPSAVAKARECAAHAGEQATAPAMLAEGGGGFSGFQAAFAACMAGKDASAAVGSMTLWIDDVCDW